MAGGPGRGGGANGVGGGGHSKGGGDPGALEESSQHSSQAGDSPPCPLLRRAFSTALRQSRNSRPGPDRV